jgi:oligopeptidase B
MRFNIICVMSIITMASCQESPNGASEKIFPSGVTPPHVEKLAKEFTLHGDKRVDEYYWLNQRDNPKVIEYLEAENRYVDTIMAGTKDLQSKLFAEMKGRIKEKDETVPYKDNGYWYYSRYEEGSQYPVYCRKKGLLTAAEEVILDQNQLAKDFPYYAIGDMTVSDDNKVLAFTVDTVSRRLYGVRFKNLVDDSMYPEIISNAEGNSLAWAADNKTFFYLKKDTTTLLEYQLYRHVLGSDPSQDVLVYEEKDNMYSMHLSRTRSRKYVSLICHRNQIATEYRLLDASNPSGQFVVFQPREEGLQYFIEHAGNKFYIRTDKDAMNFRLMETMEGATAKSNWKEIIPHRQDIMISDFRVFDNFLVLQEIKEATNQVRVINLTNKEDYYIPFDEKAYSADLTDNPDMHTTKLRFIYTSLTTPSSTFDLNMTTKERELKKQREVIGYNKDDYQTERLWVTARDGEKVPVSLVYKKGLEKNGNNPLLLNGYGSYGYSSFPFFNGNIVSLLDRGFVYAIAHVRGGQEMGRNWYNKGKMEFKKNTFFDFIDCAEFLVKEKYTSPVHLYANGGSAGGLLMGAIINLRPDLWHGVVAEVPFVDVITTMADPTIPLTTSEYKEWGNPANKDEYAYMKSYSPYDNVEKKDYPNLLVTTGLHDSQVQYFEPAKWVAKLREYKTDKNLLLFKTNMAFGHGGASGRFDYLKDEALQYAFYLALEGK